MTRVTSTTCFLLITAFVCATTVAQTPDRGAASRNAWKPEQLEGVEITEKLENQIPLDLTFIDTNNRRVQLQDLFDGEHPVILTLNYSSCPMLCSLQLNGLFETLKRLELDMGPDYKMITLSIDPKESVDRSRQTRQMYLEKYGREGAEEGYTCLTTTQEKDIKALAEAVGFGYRYDAKTREYIHLAVTIILTPDGRVSRYLYGVFGQNYPAQTLKLSLVEASEGKVGTTVDRVFLFCFEYDPDSGSYALVAYRMMQIGMTCTALVTGCVLMFIWRRESRRSKKGDENTGNETETANGV
jgi:protein SCO1/2